MTTRKTVLAAFLASLITAAPVAAQSAQGSSEEGSAPATEAGAFSIMRTPSIQHFRLYDQRGINVFEAPKATATPYTGFQLEIGGAFTQQFQGLEHTNTAAERLANGVNANQLMEIGWGFNNAVANLYLDAQLARGIRVHMTTYLSSRRHQETWVKDGYLLVDASPIRLPVLDEIMKYTTLRMGHFEINYGDAHFRRTDNGNGMYNPFVGNYILDAFTTEIGAEAYVRRNGFLAMGGVTGGEIRGNIQQPDDRGPAFLAKVGYDGQVTDNLRVRLTGSMYAVDKSAGSTLYAGDRAGSRYYHMLENTTATTNGNPTSGAINPQFRRNVTAYVVNPFVKYRGLELFGNFEQATGRQTALEQDERTWNQNVVEGLYRFLPNEQMYVGGRWNTASGRLMGQTQDVSVERLQLGGGWFVTPNILLKSEYVTQTYNDFPALDIRNGGRFNGFVVEGVVAF
jgi:hypothetical protein